ncbi:MAG: peptidoglycan-binding protein [Hyphomicrobiaceae bacterium]
MALRRLKFLGVATFAMTVSVMLNLMLMQGPRGPTTRTAAAVQADREVREPERQPSSSRTSEAARPAVAPAPREATSRALVESVQRHLAVHGYDPGVSDGVAGLTTQAAIFAFEFDHGLALTAEASEALLRQLILGPGLRNPGATADQPVGPMASELVRTVQTTLGQLGYAIGAVDGRFGPRTRSAIRQFEADVGMLSTGRVSPELIVAMGQRTARRNAGVN